MLKKLSLTIKDTLLKKDLKLLLIDIDCYKKACEILLSNSPLDSIKFLEVLQMIIMLSKSEY